MAESGQQTVLVFESLANSPTATRSQLRPIAGRRILFAVGPSVIVSVEGIAVNAHVAHAADAMTDRNDRISVVVPARSIPELGAQGGLLAQAAANGAQDQKASFDLE